MNDGVVGLLILAGIGIYGYIQKESVKKNNPDAAKRVEHFIRTGGNTVPKGMQVEGFRDKDMNDYYQGKRMVAISATVFGILLVAILLSKS